VGPRACAQLRVSGVKTAATCVIARWPRRPASSSRPPRSNSCHPAAFVAASTECGPRLIADAARWDSPSALQGVRAGRDLAHRRLAGMSARPRFWAKGHPASALNCGPSPQNRFLGSEILALLAASAAASCWVCAGKTLTWRTKAHGACKGQPDAPGRLAGARWSKDAGRPAIDGPARYRGASTTGTSPASTR